MRSQPRRAKLLGHLPIDAPGRDASVAEIVGHLLRLLHVAAKDDRLLSSGERLPCRNRVHRHLTRNTGRGNDIARDEEAVGDELSRLRSDDQRIGEVSQRSAVAAFWRAGKGQRLLAAGPPHRLLPFAPSVQLVAPSYT